MGTLFFNRGRCKMLCETLQSLGHQVMKNMTAQWENIDCSKTRYKSNKMATPVKKSRKEGKRIKNIKAFTYAEGTQYKSGEFHGGESKKSDLVYLFIFPIFINPAKFHMHQQEGQKF